MNLAEQHGFYFQERQPMTKPTNRPANEVRIGDAITYMDPESPDYEVNIVTTFIQSEGPTALGLSVLRYWPNDLDRPQGQPDTIWIGGESTQHIVEARYIGVALCCTTEDDDFKV